MTLIMERYNWTEFSILTTKDVGQDFIDCMDLMVRNTSITQGYLTKERYKQREAKYTFILQQKQRYYFHSSRFTMFVSLMYYRLLDSLVVECAAILWVLPCHGYCYLMVTVICWVYFYLVGTAIRWVLQFGGYCNLVSTVIWLVLLFDWYCYVMVHTAIWWLLLFDGSL